MVLAELLEFLGKVHFYITVGKKPTAEIFVEDKTIIVEILNPFLALNAGLQMWLKLRQTKGKKGKTRLSEIKKSGYKIRIRYKRIEFDL